MSQPIAPASMDASVCISALANDRRNVESAREAAARLVNAATRAGEDEIIKRTTTALDKKDTTLRERVDINAVICEMVRDLSNGPSVSTGGWRGRDRDSDRAREGNQDIVADRVQLQQVFMTLMLNAIDAMRDTGGELTIASQPREGAKLRISVSDTGVKLPAENPDQIFDTFVTTKPHGTGMGLAITRSIVESHGGRLWATANSGPGATFLFTLLPEAGEQRA
jgi:signal transduction histidine kinase